MVAVTLEEREKFAPKLALSVLEANVPAVFASDLLTAVLNDFERPLVMVSETFFVAVSDLE